MIMMAITAEMVPFTMALTVMGLAIKLRVAPTICMVLIRKRLLYMARRMVLSISMMDRMQKMAASTANAISTILTTASIFSTSLEGYLTVSTCREWLSISALMFTNVS